MSSTNLPFTACSDEALERAYQKARDNCESAIRCDEIARLIKEKIDWKEIYKFRVTEQMIEARLKPFLDNQFYKIAEHEKVVAKQKWRENETAKIAKNYGLSIHTKPKDVGNKIKETLGWNCTPIKALNKLIEIERQKLPFPLPPGCVRVPEVAHDNSVPKKQPPVAKEVSNEFLKSYEWRILRMEAIVKHGNRCQCCGASPADGITVINVDHIKPRKTHPELALVLDNLQILCSVCNHGKSNWDTTDWRTS
jgi:hypothetical protein